MNLSNHINIFFTLCYHLNEQQVSKESRLRTIVARITFLRRWGIMIFRGMKLTAFSLLMGMANTLLSFHVRCLLGSISLVQLGVIIAVVGWQHHRWYYTSNEFPDVLSATGTQSFPEFYLRTINSICVFTLGDRIPGKLLLVDMSSSKSRTVLQCWSWTGWPGTPWRINPFTG